MAEGGDGGLPFVGSLMSLVSHGDVRYEGVLYSIDMPNSSIAMSNGEGSAGRAGHRWGLGAALRRRGGGEEARS